MTDFITADAVTALLQVILIDLVLAGDNAIVIGLAAAGLPVEQRRRAILIGILAATALRVAFAGVATQLLQVLGLLLAGGILLLWVSWKMWRELRTSAHVQETGGMLLATTDGGNVSEGAPRKTFGQAALQIVAADISMSLDIVLAVAGAAREHPYILAFGLSIALMDIAADLIGRLLQKHRWIALRRVGNHRLCGLRDDLSRCSRADAGDQRARVRHLMIGQPGLPRGCERA